MTAADLAAELAEAEAQLAAIVPADNGDPASARLNGAALRQVHRSTDSLLARYAVQHARVENLRGRLAAASARETDASRVPLTAAQVADATHVRDRHGWHRVVRVSAKSVTVDTGYSWTDRIPLGRVLEARSVSA